MLDINKLINNDKWGDITKLVKNKKIDPLKPIVNDNTVAHLGAANNNTPLLEFLAKKNPFSLKKLNGNGESALHILVNYGYTDLFIKLLKINKELINTNNINQDSLQSLVEDNKIFSWIVKNCDVDFFTKNEEGLNVLDINIIKSNKKGDNYYKNIEAILNSLDNKKKKLLNEPDNNPLVLAIENGNRDIVKLILDKGIVDVNVQNKQFTTPLTAAVKNGMYDIVDILINKGANVNNVANMNIDDNPLNFLMLRSDNSSKIMIDKLIKHGFDINRHNKYKDTPLHLALQLDKKLSDSLIFTLIYYTDINKTNINGDTALHLLFRNNGLYDWKHYDTVLKKKELDIFKKNNENKMVINYVKNTDMPLFIDTVANSYINKFGYCGNRKDVSDNLKFKQCLDIVKKHIFDNSRSYPNEDDKNNMSKQFKIVDGEETNFGSFNSDTIHNILYTILMLKKYKNIGVPFQSYSYDKLLNDKIVETYTDVYRHNNFAMGGLYVTDIIRLYMDLFYEILPYLIIWKNSREYFVHKDLEFYLQKCFASDKIRFIFLKLTMITSSTGTHANMLIFDKNTGIFERFEPYGNVPNLESAKLDEMIERNIGRYFVNYLDKQNKKLTYLKPSDYTDGLSFQTFSNDNDITFKKLGDPFGYCLAWSFWYLETRLSNPEMHPKDIIKLATEKIIDRKSSNTKFIDFIRNYAKELNSSKNILLLDAGIKNENINDLVFDTSDNKLIINYILNSFKVIVSERY